MIVEAVEQLADIPMVGDLARGYIIIIVGVTVRIGEQVGAERADVAVAVHPADVLVALGLYFKS